LIADPLKERRMVRRVKDCFNIDRMTLMTCITALAVDAFDGHHTKEKVRIR